MEERGGRGRGRGRGNHTERGKSGRKGESPTDHHGEETKKKRKKKEVWKRKRIVLEVGGGLYGNWTGGWGRGSKNGVELVGGVLVGF